MHERVNKNRYSSRTDVWRIRHSEPDETWLTRTTLVVLYGAYSTRALRNVSHSRPIMSGTPRYKVTSRSCFHRPRMTARSFCPPRQICAQSGCPNSNLRSCTETWEILPTLSTSDFALRATSNSDRVSEEADAEAPQQGLTTQAVTEGKA